MEKLHLNFLNEINKSIHGRIHTCSIQTKYLCLFNVNHMSQITSLLVKKKKKEDKEYQ